MGKVKMTRNEYQEFLKKNAAKFWDKSIEYSMKDYNEDAENVELLPFEINSDNEDLKKYINLLCDREEKEDSSVIYRGSISNITIDRYSLMEKLSMKYVYDCGYTAGYYNDELLCTFTYCEGDVTFRVYNSIEEYQKGKDYFIKWYKENMDI